MTLVINRTFDAPVSKVWEAWSNPEVMKQWWGPEGFTCPSCNIDFQVGGTFLGCMRAASGEEFWSTGTYKEITPFQKIVCSDSFSDPDGNVVPASHYGMTEDFPLELTVTLTFEEHDGHTHMTLTHEGVPEGEIQHQTQEGWNTSLNKLATLVSAAA